MIVLTTVILEVFLHLRIKLKLAKKSAVMALIHLRITKQIPKNKFSKKSKNLALNFLKNSILENSKLTNTPTAPKKPKIQRF